MLLSSLVSYLHPLFVEISLLSFYISLYLLYLSSRPFFLQKWSADLFKIAAHFFLNTTYSKFGHQPNTMCKFYLVVLYVAVISAVSRTEPKGGMGCSWLYLFQVFSYIIFRAVKVHALTQINTSSWLMQLKFKMQLTHLEHKMDKLQKRGDISGILSHSVLQMD